MQPGGFTLAVPLTKIDVERRLVVARAAKEEPDKSSEIMDYTSAKPAFQKWSDSYADLGVPGMEKSRGNVRVMHSRTVAGKVTELSFNDEDKAVDVIMKIDDDNEWRKVLAGNYTGVSIGGGYARKWKDGALTRYTPDVREISLVDNPCMPSARIVELVKADGLVERMELRGRMPAGFAASWATRPRTFAEQWAARPRSYAELAKGFDTSKHPREHDGQFASKTGEKVGRYAGGAAAAAGGFYVGHKHAPAAAAAVGRQAGLAYNVLSGAKGLARDLNEMKGAQIGRNVGGRYGALAGAAVLGVGGYLAGSAVGAAVDKAGRVRRAKQAGKLEQYERLNADVSVVPNKRKQLKAAADNATRSYRKLIYIKGSLSDLTKFEADDHPRDDDGRFSSTGQMTAGSKRPTILAASTSGVVAGVAAGAGAVYAGHKATQLSNRVRYGSARQQAAAKLRERGARSYRQTIIDHARTRRAEHEDGGAANPRTVELAGAAHRKVMEEAANDGRDIKQAALDAARAAEQVKRARAKTTGGPAARVRGSRAAGAAIKTGVADLAGKLGRARGPGWKSAAIGLASGALLGMGSGALAGWASARHSESIAQSGAEGPKSTLASVGDALRVGGGAVDLGLFGASVGSRFGGARGAVLGGLAGLAGGAWYSGRDLQDERAEATKVGMARRAGTLAANLKGA